MNYSFVNLGLCLMLLVLKEHQEEGSSRQQFNACSITNNTFGVHHSFV